MRKVLFRFETGFIGASWEEEFEFDDDALASEIEEELGYWAEDKMRDMEYEWEDI